MDIKSVVAGSLEFVEANRLKWREMRTRAGVTTLYWVIAENFGDRWQFMESAAWEAGTWHPSSFNDHERLTGIALSAQQQRRIS